MNREEAIKILKSHYPTNERIINESLEFLIPELKESEDKRIREFLHHTFTTQYLAQNKLGKWHGEPVSKILAWLEKQTESDETKAKIFLINKGYPIDTNGIFPTYEEMYNIIRDGLEKQGEQKLDDNVEPKFHEGDWVVNKLGDSWHIDSFDKKNYQVSDGKGNYNYFPISKQDEMHLWSIADAKDGDVLVCNEELLLFKSYSSVQGRISLYCWYNGHTNNFHSKEVSDILMTTRNRICPATKEQRNLLFEKMREAGYEWDAEGKKIKSL